MTIRFKIEPEAEAQFETLDSWWRNNREAATTQLADELTRIKLMLAAQPEIGKLSKQRGMRNTRWVPLHKTPYLLYYHHEPGSDLVTILSFWSAMKKRGPKLRKL